LIGSENDDLLPASLYPPEFAIFNEKKNFQEVDRLRLFDINDVRKKKQGKNMTFHSNIIIYSQQSTSSAGIFCVSFLGRETVTTTDCHREE
jgi:hypothetical protein